MNSQIRTYLFTVSAILLLGGAVLYFLTSSMRHPN